MRIFAGGLSTETNTFSPLPTSLEDFFVRRAEDPAPGVDKSLGLDPLSIWADMAREAGHEFAMGLVAWAQPAGITVRSAYENLRDELLVRLRASLPVDAVLLALHGAMIADGFDDCEKDILAKVREIVGPDVVIGVELDPHCHLNDEKIANADIVLTFLEYPHTDINDRAVQLFNLAVSAHSKGLHPSKALYDCRMVGIYPTTLPAMRLLVDAMKAAETREGVFAVSFGHGFPFADLPHAGSKMLVIARNDALAARVAEELGREAFRLRHEIGIQQLSLPMHEALSQAISTNKAPVVVADQSDNVGGGAPGDSTFALRWLLDHGVTEVAMGIFYDPEVVRIARRAGVGANLQIRLGGKLGPFSGSPIDLDATVLALRDNYLHVFPQKSGKPTYFRAGDVAAIRAAGIEIVVSSERCQCICPSVFSDLGIDPRQKRLLIPKSTQHFFGAFAPIAEKTIYMAAPGAIVPDPRVIPYRRLDTSRLFPWIDDPFLGE